MSACSGGTSTPSSLPVTSAVSAISPATFTPSYPAITFPATTSTSIVPLTIDVTPTSTFTPAPGPSPHPAITSRAPLTITLFAASPDVIDPGDPFTLTWSASGSKVTLVAIDELLRMGSQWSVPLTGSMVITSNEDQRNYLRYQLFVSNPEPFEYVQAGVEVKLRCPDTWYFANGPPGCPWPAITGQAAIQHFEHGVMIWLEPTHTIYILHSERTGGSLPPWTDQQDLFVEGQPESDPNLIPPPGLYQPVRGFGLVWRGEPGSYSPGARDQLGWATDREHAFQGAVQCTTFPKGSCYLLQDDGRVIRLYLEIPEWKYWERP
jgi:hypothetical protein